MIDNPLEQQTLETYDNLYINEKFEDHCSDAAKELAKDNNLHPDYYEPFIEFYIEECRESDRGYFFSDDKYIKDELEKSPPDRDLEVFSFEDDLYEIIESFDEIIYYDPTPD